MYTMLRHKTAKWSQQNVAHAKRTWQEVPVKLISEWPNIRRDHRRVRLYSATANAILFWWGE